jgi:hypothetical protein
MTRGRNGSLLLSRTRLSLATPHRPPGVPASASASADSATREHRVPEHHHPWWRGLPARAETARLRNCGPTTGKSPSHHWLPRQGQRQGPTSTSGAGARCGHGLRARPQVTGSATDEIDSEHPNPSGRDSGSAGTRHGHGIRTRPPVTGSDTDEIDSENQQRPCAGFSVTPAFRRVRRSSRLRSGSPPCGGVVRSSSSRWFGHLRASRRPAGSL